MTPFARLLKAERIAQQFHETRERLAPVHGHEETTSWKDVPGPNRELMIATCADLLDRGVIEEGKFW